MRPASHHRWARTFAASAVVAIGCSSGPTLPPTDTGPTGTLLVEGSITVGPGGGLLTIRLSDTLITPIASDVYGFVSRLSPDGTTAYAFSFPTPQDVFRLVASRRPGEAVSLLEFQWPASTPVGLAVDGSGERIAFIEGNYGQGLATVRLHRLGRVGWTDLLTYTGELADLDWHRDGRRLVTTASARVTTPTSGELRSSTSRRRPSRPSPRQSSGSSAGRSSPPTAARSSIVGSTPAATSSWRRSASTAGARPRCRRSSTGGRRSSRPTASTWRTATPSRWGTTVSVLASSAVSPMA